MHGLEIPAVAIFLHENRRPARSGSTPNIHRAGNHKNVPDGREPIWLSRVQSPALHLTASPEHASPHTIRLRLRAVYKPSAQPIADQVPQGSRVPAPSIAAEFSFSATAACSTQAVLAH